MRVLPKLLVGLIAVGLVASDCLAQVRITGLSWEGMLSWENPVSNVVHEVQWAETPGGPWEGLGLVTNRNWFQLTNSPSSGAGVGFVRVSWVGATAWAYEGYDEMGGLLATGQFYLAFEKAPAVRGSWVMEAVGPIRSRHAIGKGLLTGMVFSDAHLNLDFNPGFVDNNFVTGGPFRLGTNVYAGEWSFSGFAVLDRGPFRAVKRD